MILEVFSSLPKFRTAYFSDGMNVVLADAVEDSNENESTNGLGKSTLIRIIHFCLGSNIARDRVLSHPILKGVSFGVRLSLRGQVVTVKRKIGEAGVVVSESILEGIDVESVRIDDVLAQISDADWLRVLSEIFTPETLTPDSRKYVPSFREIFLYQARMGKDAYTDPQQAFSGQPGPSRRLTLSYMLSLNWEQQRALHEDHQKREQIATAIKALEEAGEADEKSIGDMEAERVVLEGKMAEKRKEVEGFNVRQDYHVLEARLGETDRNLHDLVNDNYSDQRLLEYYQESAKEVPGTSSDEPIQLLAEAGAVFKEEALRTLSEVAAFHEQVYRNRREFLLDEIKRLKAHISARSKLIDAASSEKTALLTTLKSSGALDTLIDLQRGLTELESLHESLRTRIEDRKRFDVRKDALSASMIAKRSLLKRDLEDRRASVDEVVGLFAMYTSFLYGVPGRLSVDVKQAGYSFGISIDREGSDGVDQMVVFCFDLALASSRARRDRGPHVLIHDSTMFADVDPRQYGLALQLAAATSASEGFQYICCLNSGALPNTHMGNFELEPAVRLRLTDEGDAGRLLGIRLPPRDHAA